MKKIAEIKGEITKKGKDAEYRDEITITVTEDEDSDTLKFLIDGKEVFINRSELEEIIELFY